MYFFSVCQNAVGKKTRINEFCRIQNLKSFENDIEFTFPTQIIQRLYGLSLSLWQNLNSFTISDILILDYNTHFFFEQKMLFIFIVIVYG